MVDFDINSHLQQMGFGRGKSGDSKEAANEETSPDYVTEIIAKKAGTTVPGMLGIDLQELGKSGIQRALGGDMEGIAGKPIMPSILPDVQGGFLARLAHAIGIKNFHNIADHTQGLGGGAFIEGGPIEGTFSSSDFSSLVGSAGSMGDFDWSPASRADLGNFSPPNVGDGGPVHIER